MNPESLYHLKLPDGTELRTNLMLEVIDALDRSDLDSVLGCEGLVFWEDGEEVDFYEWRTRNQDVIEDLLGFLAKQRSETSKGIHTMPESSIENEAYQRTCHIRETKYAKLIYMARILAGMTHRNLAEAFMSEYYPPVASPMRIAELVDQIINFENASEMPGEELAYRLIKICLEHAWRGR